MRDQEPVGELIAAMRRTGHEAQWTQMIAATARAADMTAASHPTFASQLAAALLHQATGDAAARLGRPPDDLRLRAEQSFPPHGTVDLVFSDPGAKWVLLAELKLHSGYGNRQLERYVAALATIDAPAKGLIAVTRYRPALGEDPVAGEAAWLGSVRWSAIYTELLELPISDPALRAAWRAGVQLLKDQGDFGLMDFADDVMEVWGRREEADAFVRSLLSALGPQVEMIARDVLGAGPHDTAAAGMMMSGSSLSQPIVNWKSKPHIDYAVPATVTEPRLRVQFLASGGMASFTVEARYQHPKEDLNVVPEVKSAFDELLALGFEVDNDGWGHYCARIVPSATWLAEDVVDRLLAIAREAIGQLHASEIFPALARLTPVTPVTQPPPDDPVDTRPR